MNLFCLFDHMLCSCILSYSNVDPSPFEFDVVVGDDPSTNCNVISAVSKVSLCDCNNFSNFQFLYNESLSTV